MQRNEEWTFAQYCKYYQDICRTWNIIGHILYMACCCTVHFSFYSVVITYIFSKMSHTFIANSLKECGVDFLHSWMIVWPMVSLDAEETSSVQSILPRQGLLCCLICRCCLTDCRKMINRSVLSFVYSGSADVELRISFCTQPPPPPLAPLPEH